MEFFHRNREDEELNRTESPEAIDHANEVAAVAAGQEEDKAEETSQFSAPAPTPELTVPEVTEEGDYEDEDDIEPRDWRAIGLQALVAVVVLLIIVFGGRWLHHALSHKDKTTNSPTTAQSTNSGTKKIAGDSESTNNNSSNSSSSNSSGKGPGSSSSSTSSPTPTPNSTNLPNTGPGDDLAIFLAVSFTAASLHYLSRRKSLTNS